ncbi:MAG: anaerobic ribonucleoside-triphosphate reductase activating protein [Clostridiales bacterium]|nr:anaerobic ribonucleoside-triphosphate reductase activating protein [Clostridiales bacterium]
MDVFGFQSLTLLDYPGYLAATIFTGNCNFRCPFCHNADLLSPFPEDALSIREILDTLKRRQGRLEGVCITGGEPTLHPDLPDLIQQIRALGYRVKLDTNGTNPEMLEDLIQDHLLDYAAMDIKNSPQRYAETAGVENPLWDRVFQSSQILLQGRIPYEFRTTVMPELHTPEDIREIGKWIAGAPAYFLQAYRCSDTVLNPEFTEPAENYLKELLQAVLPFVPSARIRGVDTD